MAVAAPSDGIYETAELIGDTDRTHPAVMDVTDEESGLDALDETFETFGGLDGWLTTLG